MGAERMISILRLLTGGVSSHAFAFVSSAACSRALHVPSQPERGTKTDEAHTGHRGLHRDPRTVNTSSQSIHSRASFRFKIPSIASIRTLAAITGRGAREVRLGSDSRRTAMRLKVTNGAAFGLLPRDRPPRKTRCHRADLAAMPPAFGIHPHGWSVLWILSHCNTEHHKCQGLFALLLPQK